MVEPITSTLRHTARSYLEIIFHRKWLLIVPMVFATLIAWGYSYTITPMYRSTAIIEVIEKAKANPYIKDFSKSTPITQRWQAMLQKIKSRSRIADIVRELNLHENLRTEAEFRDLVITLRDNLAVTLSGDSILKISCDYPDPHAAQKIVNLITRKFIKENLELQEKETATGIEFLSKEAELYRVKLDEAADELQAFREKYSSLLPTEAAEQIYSELSWQELTGTVTNPPFMPQLLSTMNIHAAGYVDYSNRLIESGLRLKELQTTRTFLLKRLEEEPEYIVSERTAETSPAVRSLKEELTRKQVELARLSVDTKESHPLVQRLNEEIQKLQEMLKTMADQSVKEEKSSINPVYQDLKLKLSDVNQQIESLGTRMEITKTIAEAYFKKMEEVPQKQKELISLTRKNRNYDSAYSNLLAQRELAYVTRRLELEERGTKFQILDDAQVPFRPFKPNRRLILIGGFFFGLLIGGGLTVLAETTDHSFEEPNQLRDFLPVPMLGATSQILTPEEKAFINAKKRLAVLAMIVVVTMVVLTVVVTLVFRGMA